LQPLTPMPVLSSLYTTILPARARANTPRIQTSIYANLGPPGYTLSFQNLTHTLAIFNPFYHTISIKLHR
jgi:hypothetical protein